MFLGYKRGSTAQLVNYAILAVILYFACCLLFLHLFMPSAIDNYHVEELDINKSEQELNYLADNINSRNEVKSEVESNRNMFLTFHNYLSDAFANPIKYTNKFVSVVFLEDNTNKLIYLTIFYPYFIVLAVIFFLTNILSGQRILLLSIVASAIVTLSFISVFSDYESKNMTQPVISSYQAAGVAVVNTAFFILSYLLAIASFYSFTKDK